VISTSDSEPHSVPVNARRPPSRRRGWARLDPDGNEISTDEEEMIERARTITRRNNPQPFFNLFRPVVRGSSDSPTTSGGDDTNPFEIQRLDHATQPSDTTEGTLDGPHEPELDHARTIDYINPLPMPLHEMVYSPNRRTEPLVYNTKRKSPRRVIRVSPSAHLAGR